MSLQKHQNFSSLIELALLLQRRLVELEELCVLAEGQYICDVCKGRIFLKIHSLMSLLLAIAAEWKQTS